MATYAVLLALMIASLFVIIAGFFAVLFNGDYPERARDFLVGAYGYNLRVQAHVPPHGCVPS